MTFFTKGRLFKSYRCKSWSFKPDCSAKFPSFYQGNWSDDNIKVRKRNKATSWSHNWQYVLLPYYKKKGVKPEFIEQIKDSYYHQIQFAPGKKQITNIVLRRLKCLK